MILKCTCNHEFQDKEYGYKMRVHNPTAKANKYRCTVCLKEKESNIIRNSTSKTQKVLDQAMKEGK